MSDEYKGSMDPTLRAAILAKSGAQLMNALLGMKRIWASGGSVLLPPEPSPDWDGKTMPPGVELFSLAGLLCDDVEASGGGELSGAARDLRALRRHLHGNVTDRDVETIADRILAAMQR
jgi:hypothetical protein